MLDPRHFTASNLVRNWKPKRAATWEQELELFRLESKCHTLKFPGPGHVIAVYFTEIEGRKDIMRVRSTNWRAENEPNGIYKIEDCRKFYRSLLDAGMEPF